MNWTIRLILLVNGIYIIVRILKSAKTSIKQKKKRFKAYWRHSTQFAGSNELVAAIKGPTTPQISKVKSQRDAHKKYTVKSKAKYTLEVIEEDKQRRRRKRPFFTL